MNELKDPMPRHVVYWFRFALFSAFCVLFNVIGMAWYVIMRFLGVV